MPAQIVVFAAASTTDVLREAGHRFGESHHGITVVFSFDASSSLARQIRAGAAADIFISADERWMDDAAAAGEIREGTRTALLGNSLVLIAPVRGNQPRVEMNRNFNLAASNPWMTRIAVGDPAHVPAGRYARQALESLGWWASVEPLLVPAQDVRAALRLVEIGETDAGIVYSTDAARSQRVTVVAEFPGDTHEPIRYPVALCNGAGANAAEFVRFLRTTEMAGVFERAGFRVLPGEAGKTPGGGG
ncbi:MAG: molybdate ABC transporter substrate-binding protein [Phycisphaerales bacterium]|nr:molybdate ABC transporter substrate-binding protein [Phycisphaerales bacterium]